MNNYNRVMDVNINRLREGWRVLEDICRLVLEDIYLTKTLKKFRHELRDLDLLQDIESRDTRRDLGTKLHTKQECQRDGFLDVALASQKRTQEALRVLEEVLKITSSDKALKVKAIRYEMYSIEKAMLLKLLPMSREKFPEKLLYLVLSLDHCAEKNPVEIAEAALKNGVGYLQLRAKTQSDKEIFEIGHELSRLCKEHGAKFIVNDRIDIALALGADGVHIGQDDFPVDKARALIGPKMLLGVSTHSLVQLDRVDFSKVDYAGMGPVFATKTKEKPDPVVGLEVFERLKPLDAPIVAIGGIKLTNLPELIEAGCRRVAVVTGITLAEDVESVTRSYYEMIHKENKI